jgi:hypothetical protein
VTDLPADFEVALQGVDTRLKALQPGTTLGDIAYSSATANTNTRLPIGTSGQVLAVSGGVPAWTTTADVTPLTTKGDLFTFDTADARLGVGTNGQTLVADSSTATGLKWATPAGGGGKVLQVVSTTYSTITTIASTSMTDTGITLSITPTLATSKILVLMSVHSQIQRDSSNAGGSAQLMRGASAILSYTGSDIGWQFNSSGNGTNTYDKGNFSIVYLDEPATTSSTTYKLQGRSEVTSNSARIIFQANSSPSTITLMEIGV